MIGIGVRIAAAGLALAAAGAGRAEPPVTATILAPGVISGPAAEFAPAFSAGEREIFFTRADRAESSILVARKRGLSWTEPAVAPFSGRWRDLEAALAPNGRYFIFASDRPRAPGQEPLKTAYFGKAQVGGNLWRVDRLARGFGTPERLPDTVNQSSSVWTPSIAADGSLFFMQTDAETGRFRLFVARPQGRVYALAKPLAFSAGQSNDVDPAVDPRQRFVIFSSDRDQPGAAQTSGPERLFIAFGPGEDGGLVCPLAIPGWQDASESQIEPRLSRDGKVLYFSSRHPDHPPGGSPAGPWDNGRTNIWRIRFGPGLWRDAPTTSPPCRARTA